MLDTPKKLKPLGQSAVISVSVAFLAAVSGCATIAIVGDAKGSTVVTQTSEKHILIEDELVAFGKPAQAIPNMPADSVVIVGNQKSYVLSTGGTEMMSLLTGLSPKNITVESDMTFYSPYNDGHFEGTMRLSYAKPKNSFTQSGYKVIDKLAGKDCSKTSDEEAGIVRYCFKIPIEGGVFPKVSNFDAVKSQYNALSKAYPVVLYTIDNETQRTYERGNVGSLVLLPFAVAFDVVTFPIFLLWMDEKHYKK